MILEKEKEFYQKVQMKSLDGIMEIMTDNLHVQSNFSRLCELGAIASAKGNPGIGASKFFIDLLNVESNQDKCLNLLKIFIKSDCTKLVTYLIEKGTNPFDKLTEEEEIILMQVKTEDMLDTIINCLGIPSEEERKIIETLRIAISINN